MCRLNRHVASKSIQKKSNESKKMTHTQHGRIKTTWDNVIAVYGPKTYTTELIAFTGQGLDKKMCRLRDRGERKLADLSCVE